MTKRIPTRAFIVIALALLVPAATAEQADRSQAVNLEADLVGKWIERLVAAR